MLPAAAAVVFLLLAQVGPGWLCTLHVWLWATNCTHFAFDETHTARSHAPVSLSVLR